MDGNWSLKLFKNPSCLSCNSQFYIKGFPLRGSKCPWLLKCGHSLCDSCIKQNLKTSNTVTCPQCLASYPMYSVPIPEQFSFDLYLMGALAVFQIEKQEKDRKLAILTTGDANFNYSVKGKQSNSSTDNNSLLCEECSTVAYWSCENCQCHFCDPCWSKVHGAAKSLMKHVKLPTSVVETVKTEYGKCLNHEMQDLELFCKSCRKTVCSYCVIQSHQGGQHCLITMKEQNLEMVNQLKTVAEEAEMICKRMRHTLEKIKFTQSSPEVPNNQLYSSIRNQILRNFSRLHGILQLQEEKFLKQLYNKSNERENTLRDLSKQLENQIQKTEFLLEKYEAFVKKPQACDLNILYDKLSEVKTLPCYLITQKCDDRDPKVSFDESFLDSIENYCTIELPSNEVFELRSGNDLPEDFAVEPLPVSNCDQRDSINTISGSNSDLDTISNCSSKDLYDEASKLNLAKKPNVFCEGRKYSVHITYINNPGEFYVTLNSQRKMKENIEKRAMSYGYPVIVSSAICKDDLYLVKYKVDGKWYRGRIVEVLHESNGGQGRVVAHYIDYGNTDTVSLSWVKTLSPELTEEPPLAVKCKLFNCVPKNGKWSKDSVKTMEKIVNGLTATLFVMKIHPDCLEVDLSVIYPDGQIGRDIVSVRDALIFLECASFVGGTKIQENPPAVKYEEQCLPSTGESFDVVITHVNSPDDFYLHRTKQDGLYLCKLGAELQNYYNENPQKGVIYNPVIGTPCAAKFSADKKWYRAVIIDLPGKKMVSVYYVDYGNKEKIPWTDIRKLRENFVKRPPLAIHCSMSKVQGKNIENWSPQAISYLRKSVLTKRIWIKVDGKHVREPKLKVSVYEQLEGRAVCLNSLFVNMGFPCTADSQREPLSESLLQDFARTTSENEEECQHDKNYIKNPKNEITRKYKLSAEQLRKDYESEKRQFENAPVTEDDSDGSEIGESGDSVIKLKVEVLSAESPYSIYVTFPKGNEDFKILQSKLNDFYESTTPLEDKEWTVDSKCAVYCSETKCWCRASIVKVNADGKVKAFLKDFATVVTVPTSLLRELDPSFTKCGPRAIKCHLADVVPPGDTWPGISCEYLSGELEGYTEVYMTKKGEIENNSLPIELWVQKLIPASALEPTNVEWTTLNKLLVEKGLAVPKQNLWYLGITTEETAVSSEKEAESTFEKSDDVEESTELTTFLPSLSSKWLPPDPVKKSQFLGIPTYVDHDCHIYIQDTDDQEVLLEIRDSLQKEYKNSKPSAEDHFWSPGQMCIARYFADNDWYRGMVLETSEVGNYKVLFVDYGNVETCKVADLRKRVKMTHIPIQVHKYKLYGVAPASPNGKWPISVIEVLHSLIVDEKCEVIILKSPLDSEEPYPIILNILESMQDVGSILIQEHMATQELIASESSESLDPSFEEETTKDIPEDSSPEVIYASLNIPEDCKGLYVLVKALRNENEFYGHVVDSEYLPLNLKTALKQFQKLEETLAEECHLQPKLENFIEGKPCCCVHSGINKWCRGQIETIAENCVCIFYVDYGYKEFLSTDLVHECKADWCKLPKMAIKFHISNLEKCSNVSKAAYMKALTSCLMETKFYAEILARRMDYVEVELLTEKDGVLSYKQMMDIQFIKTT